MRKQSGDYGRSIRRHRERQQRIQRVQNDGRQNVQGDNYAIQLYNVRTTFAFIQVLLTGLTGVHRLHYLAHKEPPTQIHMEHSMRSIPRWLFLSTVRSVHTDPVHRSPLDQSTLICPHGSPSRCMLPMLSLSLNTPHAYCRCWACLSTR
jgi:hypothetical protein